MSLDIYKQWLMEKQNPASLIENSSQYNPHFKTRFDQFTAEVQEGDELWSYESTRHDHTTFPNSYRHCIVRDGEVFAEITTIMS